MNGLKPQDGESLPRYTNEECSESLLEELNEFITLAGVMAGEQGEFTSDPYDIVRLVNEDKIVFIKKGKGPDGFVVTLKFGADARIDNVSINTQSGIMDMNARDNIPERMQIFDDAFKKVLDHLKKAQKNSIETPIQETTERFRRIAHEILPPSE